VIGITTSRLRGNRDFQILCITQGLSRLGTQISAIAFPLLVLRTTRSPADAGIVGFAEGAAMAVALLPGGTVADRFHRRTVMVACDACCALTMALLSAAVLTRHVPMALIVPAAAVVSALGATAYSAGAAAFRLVVSDAELPQAVSVMQARNAGIGLIGPALGGLMFGIAYGLPFVVDAVSYGASLLGVLALRTSLAAPAPASGQQGTGLLKETVRGVVFVYRHKFIRFTLANAAVLNFALAGVLLSIIVTVVKGGASPLTTGAVIGFVGLGSLLGSLLAPAAKRRLSLHQAVVLVTWVCAVTVAGMAFTRNVAALAVLVAASALLVPALNVITRSAQTLITPDGMQGRVASATTFVALSINPLGSVAAGFLLARWRPEIAFLTFAAVIVVLAVASSATDALRSVRPQQPVPQGQAVDVEAAQST